MPRRAALALAGVLTLALLLAGVQAQGCTFNLRPLGVGNPTPPFQYVVGREYALAPGFTSGNYQHLDFSQMDPPLDPPCDEGPCAGVPSAGGALLRCMIQHGLGCCVDEGRLVRVQTIVSVGPVGQAIDALFDDFGDVPTQYPAALTNAYATYLAAGGNGSRVILLPLVEFVPPNGQGNNVRAQVNGYVAFFLKRRFSPGQKTFYGEFLQPLTCSGAVPSVTALWPPNHQMVPVSVVVAGSESAPISISYDRVWQDEAPDGAGALGECPDAQVIDGQLYLRAERSSQGDGRTYMINYTASNGFGMKCGGFVRVCVPRDKGRDHECVLDWPMFNSLDSCEDGTSLVAHQAVGTPGSPTSLKLDLISSGAGVTAFGYWLPRDSDVELAVYDVAGRRVATLASGAQTAGLHQISWNTSGMRNGVYFCRVQTATETTTRSVLVLR